MIYANLRQNEKIDHLTIYAIFCLLIQKDKSLKPNNMQDYI